MSEIAKPGRRLAVKVVVAILLVLLLVSGGSWIGQKTSAQSTTSNVITQQWLDQALSEWKPAQNTTVAFGVLFNRASYAYPETSYNTLPVEDANLNMLEATGANCIRIDLGYAPWLQNDQSAISEVTGLIQSIRSAGKCLVIADAASESYRGSGAIPWTQFQQAWVQRVKTLAALYHPDYYIVVKEPGWYVPLVSDATTNPAFQNLTTWLGLTENLTSTVLSVSPNTKVGIAVGADSLTNNPSGYDPYLQAVEKIPGISFIGFDIYDPVGFTGTQAFLSQYGSGGKDVWIPEAWSGSPPMIYSSSRAQLDAQWMLALYYFAQEIHATYVMPFYSDLFSSYALDNSTTTSTAQIVSFYQQRTPVFYALQSVISAGGGTSTVSSVSSSSSTSSSSQSSNASTQSSSSASTRSSVSTKPSSSQVSVSSSSAFGHTASSSITSPEGGNGVKRALLIVGVIAVVVVIGVALYTRRRSRSSTLSHPVGAPLESISTECARYRFRIHPTNISPGVPRPV